MISAQSVSVAESTPVFMKSRKPPVFDRGQGAGQSPLESALPTRTLASTLPSLLLWEASRSTEGFHGDMVSQLLLYFFSFSLKASISFSLKASISFSLKASISFSFSLFYVFFLIVVQVQLFLFASIPFLPASSTLVPTAWDFSFCFIPVSIVPRPLYMGNSYFTLCLSGA